MERERVHMVIGYEILTQAWLVGCEHVVGRLRGNIARAVVAGVEQELRVRLDTHVPDSKKQRAGGLAMTFDSEQLAAVVVLRDDGIETCELAAHAVAR